MMENLDGLKLRVVEHEARMADLQSNEVTYKEMLEKLERECQKLIEENKQLKDDIKVYKDSLKELGSLKVDLESFDSLKKSCTDLEDRIRALEAEKTGHQSVIAEMCIENQKLSMDKADLQQSIDELNQRNIQLKKELDSALGKLPNDLCSTFGEVPFEVKELREILAAEKIYSQQMGQFNEILQQQKSELSARIAELEKQVQSTQDSISRRVTDFNSSADDSIRSIFGSLDFTCSTPTPRELDLQEEINGLHKKNLVLQKELATRRQQFLEAANMLSDKNRQLEKEKADYLAGGGIVGRMADAKLLQDFEAAQRKIRDLELTVSDAQLKQDYELALRKITELELKLSITTIHTHVHHEKAPNSELLVCSKCPGLLADIERLKGQLTTCHAEMICAKSEHERLESIGQSLTQEAAESNHQVSELQAQLDQQTFKVQRLRMDFDKANNALRELDSLRKEYNDLEANFAQQATGYKSQLETTNNRLVQLESMLHAKEATLNSKLVEIDDLQASIRELDQALQEDKQHEIGKLRERHRAELEQLQVQITQGDNRDSTARTLFLAQLEQIEQEHKVTQGLLDLKCQELVNVTAEKRELEEKLTQEKTNVDALKTEMNTLDSAHNKLKGTCETCKARSEECGGLKLAIAGLEQKFGVMKRENEQLCFEMAANRITQESVEQKMRTEQKKHAVELKKVNDFSEALKERIAHLEEENAQVRHLNHKLGQEINPLQQKVVAALRNLALPATVKLTSKDVPEYMSKKEKALLQDDDT